MSSLPPGWGNRTNQMSEKDIKGGGVAATKFAAKQNQLQQSVYADDDSGTNGALTYKSSDDVRQLYLKRIEQAEEQAATASAACTSNASQSSALPPGWEGRQKLREVEAKQYGVFGRKKEGPPSSSAPYSSSAPVSFAGASRENNAAQEEKKRLTISAEEALVRVATHTLDNMASALENNNVALSSEDRAAFAEAMKRAMAALSRCR
mmetsp:Transcript_25716/g.74389  ORF Transcript_25716/g.74389 Transcript_25716/m.74389 type:complete len:207 (+) Transcript_25716:142-762(+)